MSFYTDYITDIKNMTVSDDRLMLNYLHIIIILYLNKDKQSGIQIFQSERHKNSTVLIDIHHYLITSDSL